MGGDFSALAFILRSSCCKWVLVLTHQNTRETAQAIKGMHIRKANKYLRDVVVKHQCVPFRRYNGGVGRCAQVGFTVLYACSEFSLEKAAVMTILGHLWIKDETTNLSEHLLRRDWICLTQKWLVTSCSSFSLRPSNLAGLRDVGPRRVQNSFFTCLKMLRAMLSWRYGNKCLILIVSYCW